jgi:hypothetical protein
MIRLSPILLFVSLWFVLLTWQARDHAFFWDTVQLASKQAHWYYDNDFRYFFLPEVIDSGHPPFFGMGLAGLWKIFGKSLWVGHFAMLPFLLGIVFLADQIATYFFEESGVVILLLLIAVDPFVLGQSVLVSPDLPVLFGWLLGIYAILYQQQAFKLLAAGLLALISMRGMMLVVVLFLFDTIRYISYKELSVLWVIKKAAPYVPSGLFALLFLWAHYQHAGWIGYHENSSWAPSFERTDFAGSIGNVALLGWRLMDFGRVFVLLFLIIGGGFYLHKNGLKNEKAKALLFLLLLTLLVLCPSMILHKHLTAHRYLLPVTTVMSFAAVFVLLELVKNTFWRKAIAALFITGLLTGNAWVYPKKVAQGWDSTLGHWPYYQLRQDMLDYIAAEQILLEQIGTAFPNNSDLKYIDLKPGIGAFQLFDLTNQNYIFYSNVYNDFPDQAIDELEQDWIVRKRFDRYPVCVVLYQRRGG